MAERITTITKCVLYSPRMEAAAGVAVAAAGVIFNEPTAQKLGLGFLFQGAVMSGIVELGRRSKPSTPLQTKP